MSDAATVETGGLPIRTLTRLTGMTLSLGLVMGAGVWGWRLMERETVGVPLIHAAEGPMRIAPEEPGGSFAEHQGLAVSRIAAREGEEPLANELHLAPRTVGLAPSDMPQPRLEEPQIAATDLAVAEALGLDAADLVEVSAAPPQRRETVRNVSMGGKEAVQLGAFPQEALARSAWTALVGKFPDLLEGSEQRIEMVERQGRTFWRLRAGGFSDIADARRVCAALTAGGAECVPVVVRR